MIKFFQQFELGIIKYLNLKRIFNLLKVFASYYLSNLTNRVIVWGGPYSATIEPTNRCNLKCPECPSGLGILTRPLGLISLEEFENYVKKISDTVFYLQLFFQGEPLINNNLDKFIEIAHKYKMYVSISSNATILTEDKAKKLIDAKIDKIIFSIDGMDEETYQIYRVGGSFEKAFNGFLTMLELKNKNKTRYPYIEFQFIVMKQNEHQIKKVLKLKELKGLNKVTLKTMQVYSKQDAEHFLPSDEKFRRYVIDDGVLKIKGKFKNRCFAVWRTIVITWDGNVVSCCFDKDAFTNMGNLKLSNANDVWKGKKFYHFRRAIQQNRAKIPICRNCTEGVKINI